MAKEKEKKGLGERTANFMERLNRFLGATALGGAVVAGALGAPAEVVTGLVAYGVFQFVENDLIWSHLKKRSAKKKQGNPKTAPAPA